MHGTVTAASPPPRLLDQVRNRLRTRHYSLRTETTYVDWIKRFILFHGKRYPRDMGGPEAEAFLSSLAVERKVSASTQSQVLAAILFLYREVLEQDLPWMQSVVRAKKPRHLPTVLHRAEVDALLAHVDTRFALFVGLLYGTGIRLLEGARLRVKDVDFARREITVRDGKGGKDRVTMLPQSLQAGLAAHLKLRRAVFDADLATSPPLLSSAGVWSPILMSQEIGREEAVYRRADHQVPEGSRCRASGEGPVSQARVFRGELLPVAQQVRRHGRV